MDAPTRLLPMECTDKIGVPFSIRLCPGAGADCASLRRLYDEFEPKECAQSLPPRCPQRRARWIDGFHERALNLVAAIGQRVVGHAALLEIEPGERCEYLLFVHQDYQDRGIGTVLSRAACRFAEEAGYRSLWLTVEASNPRAMRVYQKVGFRKVGALDLEMEMRADLVSEDA
jgi:RimJ/RimL family protein N-acetyltransferase